MKKILIVLIILSSFFLLTGCEEKGKEQRLTCTRDYLEELLEGKATIEIDYDEEGKAKNYNIDANYHVKLAIYETYGSAQEDNMKTISNSILNELKKDYGEYNPEISSSIDGNSFIIKITVNDENFLKTIGTIDKEKEMAETTEGKFTCSIQDINN